MSRYFEDGSPLSSSVPTSEKRPNAGHNQMFGIYRGVVLQVVYPDDPKNITKDRIEYVIKVKGQVYPNAISVLGSGGKYNYNQRVRKPTEKSESGQIKRETLDEFLDGEAIYVMFLEGHGNVPLIVGASENPLRGKYKKFSKAQGVFDIEEFNGVEFLIDKDSNYTIKQVGRKNAEGVIQNPTAVGTQIKIYGNGNIELDAKNNKVMMDDAGVKVDDKNGNTIEMKSGAVTINVSGQANVISSGKTVVSTGADCEINAGADCKITASGDCKVTASTVKLNGSSGMVLTTVTDPVVDLITGVPTQGVPTVKAG